MGAGSHGKGRGPMRDLCLLADRLNCTPLMSAAKTTKVKSLAEMRLLSESSATLLGSSVLMWPNADGTFSKVHT
eukprot:1259776-Amphidinium_carterae.1